MGSLADFVGPKRTHKTYLITVNIDDSVYDVFATTMLGIWHDDDDDMLLLLFYALQINIS